MQQKISLMFLMASLILFRTENVWASIEIRRYQIRSGIIEYNVEGVNQGKENLYFDQWGMREARYSTIRKPVLGLTHIMTLLKGEWIYIVDFDKGVGNKRENEIFRDVLKETENIGVIDISEVILKHRGGKKTGQEFVAGKMCDVWEIPSERKTLWVWKGIPLKRVQRKRDGSQTTSVATKINEGVDVAEKLFVVPDNIFIIKEDVESILISQLMGAYRYRSFLNNRTLYLPLPAFSLVEKLDKE